MTATTRTRHKRKTPTQRLPAQSAAELRTTQRWAWLALGFGLAGSMAANYLSAEATTTGRALALVWPITLAITIHLALTVPSAASRWITRTRTVATIGVAGVAAWASYWHIVDLALAHGETGLAAYLTPIAIDGMMLVATVTVIQLGPQIEAVEAREQKAADRAEQTRRRREAAAKAKTTREARADAATVSPNGTSPQLADSSQVNAIDDL